ncbi:hypothetical protein HQ545_05670 [Candidatus Woesearchaeota archaeon]|nr:hypothetical protein [Candidatus Woesearchaeota archaeon]
MYQLNFDYPLLTARVEEEILKRQKADPSFSLDGIKIDELVSEKELKQYAHDTTVLVAAEQGLFYYICEGVQKIMTVSDSKIHQNPVCRVNGVFGEISGDLVDILRAEYLDRESSTCCNICEDIIRKDYKPQITERQLYAA